MDTNNINGIHHHKDLIKDILMKKPVGEILRGSEMVLFVDEK